MNRIYRRIPKQADSRRGTQAEVCPFTGLNKGQLYQLINQVEEGTPLIKTVSMAEEGEKHGARLYNVGSVLRHLDRVAKKQGESGTA